MYIIRNIFRLKFGHFRDAKELMKEAKAKNFMPGTGSRRVLSDFTGESYRFIMEESYESLAAFEKSMSESMGSDDWKKWYEKFKAHVNSSYREILKEEVF